MSNITAAMVKALRERTGAGMMECKKALVETGGDIEAAIEHMRKAGLAKADKKAGRTAAEGKIAIKVSDDGKRAVILEVNSETDFVAKNEDFLKFVDKVAQRALETGVETVEQLLETPIEEGGPTVEEARRELVAKLGENIAIRRLMKFETEAGKLACYLHGNRIGVVVEMEGGDDDLAKDIAMHIAASKPVCVEEKDVPAETLEKEKEIFTAQAEASGKPANIVEKMVEGRLRKFLKEVTLLGQPFVKDPDLSVGQLLDQKGARVVRFVRFEVGEGIEKQQADFAEEVMAQVRGD
ncbi:elongation factor Ts [Methylomarinovum caldicuralii]|uniref:Elongation factor Ts n=1 Tax=Methylomarinovum caldicuralii TaxID=438856 RepID=A0AAU9CSQ5_9GAMM|nr:translation elongation factor Ts [Methylomarinovum caldicuralii]BCX80947.1 elongation factor Ts [Methylomarinovum caldicuralii]